MSRFEPKCTRYIGSCDEVIYRHNIKRYTGVVKLRCSFVQQYGNIGHSVDLKRQIASLDHDFGDEVLICPGLSQNAQDTSVLVMR
jgi:hypothetical protein